MNINNKTELIGVSPNSLKIKQYKKSLSCLSSIQWETSVGLMLGDASLQTQNKGNTYRMKFEWGNKNKPYLDHVYNLFSEWVLSNPHKKVRYSPNNKQIINWGFQTISHEAFNKLAELFLNNNRKIVSNNLIQDHLTPIGLAYWFMDDGGKLDYNLNSKNKSIVLNTHNFYQTEVEIMVKQLNKKFNLVSSSRLNKGKYVIVIKNYDTFISLTDNYIIPEMKYKLP